MQKLFLLLFLLIGCNSKTTTPIGPIDSSYCDAAQAQLLKLQCKDGWGHLLGGPNAAGVSYGDRCRLAEKNGVPQNPLCISTVNSCSEVDPCLQRN